MKRLTIFALSIFLCAWTHGSGSGIPTNAYVAEDGATFYVAEDGTTYYVQEN